MSVERCKEKIWRSTDFYRCTVTAKRDGFCGTHHPEARARRRQHAKDNFEKKMAVFRARDKSIFENEQKAQLLHEIAEELDELFLPITEALNLMKDKTARDRFFALHSKTHAQRKK